MKTAINLLILIVLWCIASEMSYQDAVAAQVVMVGRIGTTNDLL